LVWTGFGFPAFATNYGLVGVHDHDTTTTVVPLRNLSHCSSVITYAPYSCINTIPGLFGHFGYTHKHIGITAQIATVPWQ